MSDKLIHQWRNDDMNDLHTVCMLEDREGTLAIVFDYSKEKVTCPYCKEGKPQPIIGATMHNPVHRPTHYTQGKVECIDALEAAVAGLTGIEAVCTANAIKYLWRWKLKGGTEDLHKAKWYIDRILKGERKDD